MNDNLPDIGFKEKKEKRGGFIGWLRGKLGFGSRGGMGQAGVNPAAMNAGRSAMDLGKAFGAGKFGASSAGGLAALFAGKASTIAAIAMVALASGVYLANNAPAPSTSTAAFSSNTGSDNYVPAILRSQSANSGSSLDMFKDTNKGSLAMDAGPATPAKPVESRDGAAEGEPQAQHPGAPGDMAEDMMSKLQGGNMASLTSQLGGGSSKFSNMGGFSNKFGQGAVGPKAGFTSGIGSGFSAMPKFDSRKNKMLAMKGSARPVFGGAKAGKKGNIGAGAFNQVKGMRDIQKSYTGNSIDGARSTQDKAWEGTTADGDASGGAGLSDGGAGIVSGPSLDNADGMSGGGDSGTGDDVIPDETESEDVSPWADDLSKCMSYIIMSCILSFIASKISNATWIGKVIAIALAAAAALLAVAALAIAIDVMGSQALMGTIYLIGSVMALAAAVMAIAGTSSAINSNAPSVAMLAAGAGVISLIGSMLGGS